MSDDTASTQAAEARPGFGSGALCFDPGLQRRPALGARCRRHAPLTFGGVIVIVIVIVIQRRHTAPNTKTAPEVPVFQRVFGRRAKKIPPSRYSPTQEMGSTIAEAGLNFRVRNGNGCGPRSMDGGKTLSLFPVP